MQLIRHKTISITSKILGFLGVAVFLTVYFFAFTSTGIAWILNSNLKDPHASISISSVSSNLQGTTTIENLIFSSDTVDIVFENFTLHWNPLTIFSDQIYVKSLEGSNLNVNLKTVSNSTNKTIAIEFPIEANIAKAFITNFSISANDKAIYSVKQTDIDNIYLAESFFAEKIVFNTGKNQWIALSGQFGFSSESFINLTTESIIALPGDYDSIRAKGTLVGNLAQVRFLQRIDLPFDAEISGRISNILHNPSYVIDARLHQADMPLLSNKHFLNHASGEISLRGNSDHFELTSDLSILDSEKNRWSANLTSVTQDQLMDFKIAVNSLNPSKKANASFKGSYNFRLVNKGSQLAKGLKLEGNWSNIQFTLRDNNTITSRSGNINIDGENHSTKLTANGIQLQKLGPTITRLVMNTSNAGDGKIAFTGKASTNRGDLQLSGKILKITDRYRLDTLSLSGKNFPLVRKPQAHIVISPNVSFIRKDDVMTSMGTVKVPMANIQLQDFRNTVRQIASIVGSDKKQLKSLGHVDVEFGKSVWMHGYGLNAHVTGDLSLTDLSAQQIVATGELKVLRGNYQNLSEKHQLKGGRLKFDNRQLDDPELELKISKRSSLSNTNSKIIGRLQKLYKDSSQRSSVIKPDDNLRSAKEKIALRSPY